jgi:hypothetical protein
MFLESPRLSDVWKSTRLPRYVAARKEVALRRILFTLAASVLIAAVMPAAALAHSGGHHRRHHARHQHHVRVRHQRFGDVSAPVTADNAGTVTSFDGTTLTIQLDSGSTVSGAVTPDTAIECQGADVGHDVAFHKDDHGGGPGGGDNGGNGGQGGNGDNGGANNDMNNCTAADLTPGAVVHEAELRVSSAGATWDKVELVVSQNQNQNQDQDDN